MHLREYLDYHDIAVEDFADEIGMAKVSMYFILNATYLPSLPTAIKIYNQTEGDVSYEDMLYFYTIYHKKKRKKKKKK